MVNNYALSNEAKNFLTAHPIAAKYLGRPYHSPSGEVFYPVRDTNFFMRYFISTSRTMYDIVENQFKKFAITDKIVLISTTSNSPKIVRVGDLYWNTFYRFPMASAFDKNTKESTSKMMCDYLHHKPTDSEMLIEGVHFKEIIYPTDSVYFNHFIKRDHCRLVISEEGAIYDVSQHKFRQILLDDRGMPFIASQCGLQLPIPIAIAFAWFDKQMNFRKYQINTAAEAMLFCNANNIIFFKPGFPYTPVASNLIIQQIYNDAIIDISQLSPTFLKYHHGLTAIESVFGKFYRIPILGLENNYYISKCGMIYSMQDENILRPTDLKFNGKHIIDILYYFPEIENTLSISELILWTFFRLYPRDISSFEITINTQAISKIPIIDDMWIITKTSPQIDATCIISDTVYRQSPAYIDLYMSKTGALYNATGRKFIDYSTLEYVEDMLCMRVAEGSRDVFVKLGILMYKTWFSSTLPSGTVPSYRNGIREDISLHNLSNHIMTPVRLGKRCISKLPKIEKRVNHAKSKELAVIKEEYATGDFELLKKIHPLSYLTKF